MLQMYHEIIRCEVNFVIAYISQGALKEIAHGWLAISFADLAFGKITISLFPSSNLQTKTLQARVHSDRQHHQSRRQRPTGKSQTPGPVRLCKPSEALQHILAFAGIYRPRIYLSREEARIAPRAIFVGKYVEEAYRPCRSGVDCGCVR